jgi:hypothetical protein
VRGIPGKGRRAHSSRRRRIPAFDCIAVSSYDNVPGIGSVWAGEVRKALSQIARLLKSWFVNAKRLFHLLVALAFMFLTVMGASETYTAWGEYRKTPEQGLARFTMFEFGAFTIFLAILCLYSFAKARSVR